MVSYASAYFFQGHRFNILEDIGYYPAIYYAPCFCFEFMLASRHWCGICRIRLYVGSIQFSLHLKPNNYCRSCYPRPHIQPLLSPLRPLPSRASGTINIPFPSYMIAHDAKFINPRKGRADDHANFSRVEQFPTALWRMDGTSGVALEISRFL